MDMAFCVKDNRLWDAKEFRDEAKKHPKEWLEERRKALICGGCEQKAKFTNAKKRNVYFGVVQGYKHDDDCDFLGDFPGRKRGPGTPLPNRDPAVGNKEIRYSKVGLLNPPARGGNGGNSGGNANGSDQGVALGRLHETTGLRNLLKNLRCRPDYPPTNLRLDVPARGSAVLATDYFYKIADITIETTRDTTTRAFWGKIFRADDKGAGKQLWINCDNKGALFSIWMYSGLKDELYQSLGITSSDELRWSHVIVEGIMNQSKKLTVHVTDLKMIAFLSQR